MTAYRVKHTTLYEYGDPVVSAHDEAHLLPRSLPRQQVSRVELRIDPTPDTVAWHRDYFGNEVVFFALLVPHDRLEIRTESRVELRPPEPFDPQASCPWDEVARIAREDRSPASLEAYELVFDSPFVKTSAELADYARPSFPAGRPLGEGLLDLSHRIHTDVRYDPEATTLDTPVDEALRNRHGVCQDFAHVAIGALRSLGIPARYVSGYLRTRRSEAAAAVETRPPEKAAGNGEKDLVGSEASHAWLAAWDPDQGWLDVDPTNDLVPGDRHVTLAWGRDYDDVSPVKGMTLGGGRHTIDVAVEVRPETD